MLQHPEAGLPGQGGGRGEGAHAGHRVTHPTTFFTREQEFDLGGDPGCSFSPLINIFAAGVKEYYGAV